MVVTVQDMDRMTPAERADAVAAATVTSWDEVPEPLRSQVLAQAVEFGRQRRSRN